MTVTAFAPASIGNLAAGFDVLGLAVTPTRGEPWGDSVTARFSDGQEPALEVVGPHAAALPPDPRDNLVLRCHELYAARLKAQGLDLKPVRYTLHKGLPLCSGLGSSSASVVATLVALNALCHKALDCSELLTVAGEGEAVFSGAPHLDNVAPALLGGLQLVGPGGVCGQLPWPREWRIALVHPHVNVATEHARAVLPGSIPLGAAVAYWQNLAAFVHALHTGDRALARATLKDSLIECHRKALVPGFDEAKAAALGAGAFAFSISGSGPSMFAMCDDTQAAARALAGMVAAVNATGTLCDGDVFRVDPVGARCV